MTTIVCRPEDFAKVFAELEAKRVEALKAATVEAATIGVRVVRSHLPKDQGDLVKTTHLEVHEAASTPGASGPLASIVEDQPYASAMEVGTRPFTPPFAPILSWAVRHSPKLAQQIHRFKRRLALRDLKFALRGSKAAERAFGSAQRAFEKARQSGNRSRIARARIRRLATTVVMDQKNAARRSFAKVKAQTVAPEIQAYARAVWQSIRTRGIRGKFGTKAALPRLGSILLTKLRAAQRDWNKSIAA